ncbi:phosphonate metabolism transcriptional regulator PhnF [Breoghania sp.]|uniref:phosphonate metabolism transcriptional regulator PhnF n=1 Tax=Breoghania sp. TaxID=2065378 RepID=UPI00261CEC74|nr:phosphonate metabolism transcriptional regulator PhnF [Breoghania sp.]MDJ0930016.1 phosphonate metabolism transcriptional regulator PhnF [Breoghania sp.]
MMLSDDGTGDISMERSTGVALWRQIAERLKTDLRTGVWGQGAKLPAESELAQRFGVNHHTIRRAVSELANEGLVSSLQGRGTFVESTPISYPIGSRTRFPKIISRQAREPGGRLIASFRETTAPWLTDKLHLPAGAVLHRLETLHVADGIPVSVSTAWFPAARFPDLVLHYAETGSVTKALAAHGVTDYSRAHTDISARIAEPEEARLLQIAPNAPVLVTAVINVDANGTPIQVARTRFAAERIQLSVKS